MSKYKVLKDNIKNVVAQEFEKTIPIIAEEYETKIRRQAAEITRLLEENKELKERVEKANRTSLSGGRIAGQNEAWELAKKIVGDVRDSGYSPEELGQIFRYVVSQPCIMENTYQEAAAKVAEWEKAKEKICVGDVVRFKENNSIEFCITQIGCNGYLYGVGRNGATYSGKNPELWEKTGRHIDIGSFLKQIGEE